MTLDNDLCIAQTLRMALDLDNPHYLGSAEVCERLGIDRSTLVRWVQLGRIPYAMRLPGQNGAYLFDPRDVERLAAERAAS